eukprot:TRINITY_DN14814_c0_g1_i2.p1 TRINITY_DN14814_c0_g1~~TRINITY_DN14814_c0_g1_i2.p1  ORF type:complete len:102 (-),score=15.94 TRINITY_DN14814_c0_g1_i2:608-913(-)
MAMFGDLPIDHFVSLPYFTSLKSQNSSLFRGIMKEWYGAHYVVTDQVDASYAFAMAWAAAASTANNFESQNVLKALWTSHVKKPAGIMKVSKTNYLTTNST